MKKAVASVHKAFLRSATDAAGPAYLGSTVPLPPRGSALVPRQASVNRLSSVWLRQTACDEQRRALQVTRVGWCGSDGHRHGGAGGVVVYAGGHRGVQAIRCLAGADGWCGGERCGAGSVVRPRGCAGGSGAATIRWQSPRPSCAGGSTIRTCPAWLLRLRSGPCSLRQDWIAVPYPGCEASPGQARLHYFPGVACSASRHSHRTLLSCLGTSLPSGEGYPSVPTMF
jgi:hypothetical protein